MLAKKREREPNLKEREKRYERIQETKFKQQKSKRLAHKTKSQRRQRKKIKINGCEIGKR